MIIVLLENAIDVLPKLRTKHFKFLRAIFGSLRKYRYVPIYVISRRMRMKSSHVRKIVEFLKDLGLVEMRKKEYEGYGLTMRGLDILALKALSGFVDIEKITHRYDVGKEADIHVCLSFDKKTYILKVFRLGRTSFKKVRSVRPSYETVAGGWILLSVNAARREYEILRRLWEGGISVPKPLYRAYHMILMEYVNGIELVKAYVTDPLKVFRNIIFEIFKAYYVVGVIHADLSEYNVLVDEKTSDIWIIDWPQWLEVEHEEAEGYMEKDMEQIVRFFVRKHRINPEILENIIEEIKNEFRISKHIP